MVVAIGCGTVAVAVGVAGVIVMTRRLIDNNKAETSSWGRKNTDLSLELKGLQSSESLPSLLQFLAGRKRNPE